MNFLCGNNCSWIIILVIIAIFFCNNDCGTSGISNSGCGCGNSGCGCC